MEHQIIGAIGKSGVTENTINLSISKKLEALLKQNGAKVILTRSDENGIYDSDKKTIKQKYLSDKKNRIEIINNSNADIFVSIHLNIIPQEKYSGWQTFFRTNDEKSEKLAKAIQEGLNKSINLENNRKSLAIKDIYIVEKTTIPVSIVECGFLSNEKEEKLLQEEEYQDKLAWGIYLGINEYFF